jgi:hypothetical protein
LKRAGEGKERGDDFHRKLVRPFLYVVPFENLLVYSADQPLESEP